MAEQLPNPIDQFLTAEASKVSKYSELFKGNDDFIDQMSEVTHDEVRSLTALMVNDEFLESLGIGPVFDVYVHHFLRLQVSKDRKSRQEYVDVHKAQQQMLEAANLQKELPR